MTLAMLRRAATPVAAALVGSAITALLLVGRPQPVQAQAESAAAFIMGYVMRPTDANKSSLISGTTYHGVYTFEGAPVFVVQNKTSLYVVEVVKEGIRIMLEIPIDPTQFKEVIVLGDNLSFIVRYEKSLRVYTIDRRAHTVEAQETIKK